MKPAGLVVLVLSCISAHAGTLVLKRAWVEEYKDRATIVAQFKVDHAHNPEYESLSLTLSANSSTIILNTKKTGFNYTEFHAELLGSPKKLSKDGGYAVLFQ